MQDTAITADAAARWTVQPLERWRDQSPSEGPGRRFPQLPHLPKMLKSQAIIETLVEGCVQGTFVLQPPAPTARSARGGARGPTWRRSTTPRWNSSCPGGGVGRDRWRTARPQRCLPELWLADEITVLDVMNYFSGTKVVQVEKGGFSEPVTIPKAAAEVVEAAIGEAVSDGKVWLLSGPASLLAEPIPAGVLTHGQSCCRRQVSAAAAILPETLSNAWKGESSQRDRPSRRCFLSRPDIRCPGKRCGI